MTFSNPIDKGDVPITKRPTWRNFLGRETTNQAEGGRVQKSSCGASRTEPDRFGGRGNQLLQSEETATTQRGKARHRRNGDGGDGGHDGGTEGKEKERRRNDLWESMACYGAIDHVIIQFQFPYRNAARCYSASLEGM